MTPPPKLILVADLAETAALIPNSQIHSSGMLPRYGGFGESQVATALIATPASLQAGTELNLHKGTPTCNRVKSSARPTGKRLAC